MNLIIFGPPGAGKGTQAKFIVKKFNLFQLSMGDLLRDEVKNKTELGNKIDNLISKGNFANDEIVNQLLEKIITNQSYKNNIVFDGYPRTISQAKNLEKILSNENQSIHSIFFLNVPREIVEKRIMGRMTCEKCNITLNEFFNNEDEINNHKCGSEYLKKREDDNEKTIIKRYDEYMKKTKPVLDYYSSSNNFYEIDGGLKIDVITSKIDQILRV